MSNVWGKDSAMFIDKKVPDFTVNDTSLVWEIMQWNTGAHSLLCVEENIFISILWMSGLAYSDNHWIFNIFNGLSCVIAYL